jgi:hypothetical protein
MDRPHDRTQLITAAVAAAVGLAILTLACVLFLESRGFGYDFVSYDAAARRVAEGVALYLPGTAELYAAGEYEGLYLYPPPLAVALMPLTILSVDGSTIAWLTFRLALLAIGCWMMPVSRVVRLLVFAVATVSFPVLFDLNIGNVSIITFALCALAWRWIDRPASALIHAILVAIRFPFGLYFLEWLVRGRWRTIARTVGFGLLLIVLTLPFVGLSAYPEYVTLLRSLPDITIGEHNLSLRSTALAAGLPGTVAVLANLFGYIVGAAAIVYAARRRDPETSFMVGALATLLVSPFLHPHYLVLLLLPAALLAQRGRSWGLALPLLGWLPGPLLPLVAPLAIGAVIWSGRPSTVAAVARSGGPSLTPAS